ncbi:MAG: glutamate synthase subunit beta [Atopobiaceae bacterium]
MGKPGAYLVEGRRSHFERAVKKTVKDFEEFAIPLGESEQRVQASRCMYCGVAFCQAGVSFGKARTSGCPLHNLIPEWNDLLWRGQWDDAAQRLALTNPFPEFTGRVCPALCEASCNLGLHEEPTTIRDNERAISDHEWEHGLVKPLKPAPAGAPRVAVVGSGPSGLGCAWELARRGLKVTVIEKHDRPGGLLMYGIPNMKLPKDVVERRCELMRQSGIEFACGVDATRKSNAKKLLDTFDAVVVAAGAGDARTLRVPGADLNGVHLAVDYLTAQTKALLAHTDTTISAKGKDVIVIGGGDTGTDCVATALRQGAKSVHQLEFMPAPPDKRTPQNQWPEWPNVKKADYGQVEAIAMQGEDPRTWATDTLEVLGDEDGNVRGLRVVTLDWSNGKPERMEDTERTIDCQMVLLAMGFLGPQRSVFDALGVELQDGPRTRPQLAQGHKAQRTPDATGKAQVFVAGDARTGSSIVVSALSDGLQCAAEVAQELLK